MLGFLCSYADELTSKNKYDNKTAQEKAVEAMTFFFPLKKKLV